PANAAGHPRASSSTARRILRSSGTTFLLVRSRTTPLHHRFRVWAPRGSGAAVPYGGLRAIDATARPRLRVGLRPTPPPAASQPDLLATQGGIAGAPRLPHQPSSPVAGSPPMPPRAVSGEGGKDAPAALGVLGQAVLKPPQPVVHTAHDRPAARLLDPQLTTAGQARQPGPD